MTEKKKNKRWVWGKVQKYVNERRWEELERESGLSRDEISELKKQVYQWDEEEIKRETREEMKSILGGWTPSARKEGPHILLGILGGIIIAIIISFLLGPLLGLVAGIVGGVLIGMRK